MENSVCIVGAGVVGLTTAVKLQQQIPGLDVTLLSEKFSPDLTSNVAAGIFLWGPGAPDKETDKLWAKDSWTWYEDLLKLNRPEETGVSKLPVYLFSSHRKDQVERRMMNELCSVYRDCTAEELRLPQPEGKFKFGKYLHSLQIDTKPYLAYLLEKFKEAGGKVCGAKVESLIELTKNFKVVVNCSGLGARELCKDKKVLPLRGQVIRVSAPWIKTALYADDVYVIPGQKWVTVGGTRQYNDWMTDVSPHDSARIWSRAIAAFPNLAAAEILDETVGLRPHRHTPRVEVEHLENGGSIVHNYGHCGYGVLASPGTSQQAVVLVKNCLSNTNAKM